MGRGNLRKTLQMIVRIDRQTNIKTTTMKKIFWMCSSRTFNVLCYYSCVGWDICWKYRHIAWGGKYTRTKKNWLVQIIILNPMSPYGCIDNDNDEIVTIWSIHTEYYSDNFNALKPSATGQTKPIWDWLASSASTTMLGWGSTPSSHFYHKFSYTRMMFAMILRIGSTIAHVMLMGFHLWIHWQLPITPSHPTTK